MTSLFIVENIISDENLITLIIVTAALLFICIVLLVIVAIRASIKKKKNKLIEVEAVEETVVTEKIIKEEKTILEPIAKTSNTIIESTKAAITAQSIEVQEILSTKNEESKLVVEEITQKVETITAKVTPEVITSIAEVVKDDLKIFSKQEPFISSSFEEPKKVVEPESLMLNEIEKPVLEKIEEPVLPIVEEKTVIETVETKTEKLKDFSEMILNPDKPKVEEIKLEKAEEPKIEEKPIELKKEEKPIIEKIAEEKPVVKQEKLIDFSDLILGNKKVEEVIPAIEKKMEPIADNKINESLEIVEENIDVITNETTDEIDEIPEPLSEDDYIVEEDIVAQEEVKTIEPIVEVVAEKTKEIDFVKDLEKSNIFEEKDEEINALINDSTDDRENLIKNIGSQIEEALSETSEENIFNEKLTITETKEEQTIKIVEKVIEDQPKTFTDWLSSINKK